MNKPKPAAKKSLKQPEREALETFAYEAGMVNLTRQMVVLAETQKVAALESHLVHVRALMEFFKHEPVGTALWAGNFTKSKWRDSGAKAVWDSLNRGPDGTKAPILARITARLSHMDKERNEHDHEWNVTELNAGIQALVRIFWMKAKDEYREDLRRLLGNMGLRVPGEE